MAMNGHAVIVLRMSVAARYSRDMTEEEPLDDAIDAAEREARRAAAQAERAVREAKAERLRFEQALDRFVEGLKQYEAGYRFGGDFTTTQDGRLPALTDYDRRVLGYTAHLDRSGRAGLVVVYQVGGRFRVLAKAGTSTVEMVGRPGDELPRYGIKGGKKFEADVTPEELPALVDKVILALAPVMTKRSPAVGGLGD